MSVFLESVSKGGLNCVSYHTTVTVWSCFYTSLEMILWVRQLGFGPWGITSVLFFSLPKEFRRRTIEIEKEPSEFPSYTKKIWVYLFKLFIQIIYLLPWFLELYATCYLSASCQPAPKTLSFVDYCLFFLQRSVGTPFMNPCLSVVDQMAPWCSGWWGECSIHSCTSFLDCMNS